MEEIASEQSPSISFSDYVFIYLTFASGRKFVRNLPIFYLRQRLQIGVLQTVHGGTSNGYPQVEEVDGGGYLSQPQ